MIYFHPVNYGIYKKMKNTEKILKLKIHALFKRSKNICFVDGKKVFEISNTSHEILSLVKSLVVGVDMKFITEYVENNIVLNAFYNWLLSKKWIMTNSSNPYINTINEKNFEYFRAIDKDPISIITTLRNSHISIVGCGGIGAIVAQNLVAMGFLELSLIDYDIIEHSNLNRQTIYSYNDIGKNKAEALVEKLKFLNPNIKVTAHIKKIERSEDLNQIYMKEKPDFMVCGIDTPPIHAKINIAKFCSGIKIPCIYGSVGITSGSYGPLLDHETNINAFINFLNAIKEIYMLEDIRPVSGSLCSTNSIIASNIALDIVKWFSNSNPLCLNKTMTVDFSTAIGKCTYNFANEITT